MKCIRCGEREAIDDEIAICRGCHGTDLLASLDRIERNAHERWLSMPTLYGFADREAAERFIESRKRR